MNERVALGWLLPLRLLMGVILVVAGWEKFSSGWLHGDQLHNAVATWLGQHRPHGFFRPVLETARAHPKIFGTLVTIGECAIGTSFVLGAFTRPMALLGTILLASIAAGSGETPLRPGTALMMAAISLTFVFTAPGRFLGIDQALRGRLPRWLV